jgi:hypothetical protein
MPDDEQQRIRQVDSASKKSKKANKGVAHDEVALLTSQSVSSTMSPQALEAPPPPDDSCILGDMSTLPCVAITTQMLEQHSQMHLRRGRVIIKNRSVADKKESVRSFLVERNKVQWLPTCCICHEKRISDGSDVKSEMSIQKQEDTLKSDTLVNLFVLVVRMKILPSRKRAMQQSMRILLMQT